MKPSSQPMKSSLFALTLALAGACLPVANAAQLSGKVSLTGTPKPEITIDMATDATCGAMHKEKITTRHFVVGKDNGLANVFVYLKEGAAKAPAVGAAPLLDQVKCVYEPYVLGVVAGQKFKIRNSDAGVLHNVHALPKINPEFNFGQPLKDQVNEKSFDKPEVMIRMKCDVHPWMFAFVSAVDHPYFAVTDKDGNFTIANVPAGTYTVEAIHQKAGAKTEKVTVTQDDKKTVNFTLAAP